MEIKIKWIKLKQMTHENTYRDDTCLCVDAMLACRLCLIHISQCGILTGRCNMHSSYIYLYCTIDI
jgi:hypothetical protein